MPLETQATEIRRRVHHVRTCALLAFASALALTLLTPAARAQLPARTLGPVSGKAIGFIDLAGRDVVEEMKRGENSPYLAARSFHEGYAGVQRLDGLWTWINTNGRAITSRGYYSVSDFVDGVAWARTAADTNRLVAIDRVGGEHDVRVPLGAHVRRSRYGFFRERNASGELRRGYVSATGERVTAPEFTAIGPFVGGRGFAARSTTGSLVMLDINGRFVADSGMFMKNFPVFADNRAALSATAGGPIGYMDSTAKWVIAPSYAEATDFSEERAAVKKAGAAGWNVIKPDGALAFAGEFKTAPDFYSGYARVTRVGEDTTFLIDRNGKSPKVSSRNAREVGTNGFVYSSDGSPVHYENVDGKTVIAAETLRGRRIASAGNPFIEGFALVSYNPVITLASDGDASSGSGGGAAVDTASLTTFVWYELRRSMGSIMGNANSAKQFTVYWGTVKAPANTPIGRLTALFPERPRQTLAPTRRIDAVALEQGEELDIEEVIVKRNRADFTLVRRGGKERIEDNVKYQLMGTKVLGK